jgi:hypothetical protein
VDRPSRGRRPYTFVVLALLISVLTGIHAYLGFHVIAREVVFVDKRWRRSLR